MDAQDLNLSRAQWRKASRSAATGSCVEVAVSMRGGAEVDAQDLDLSQVRWRKGSRSAGNGSCVEVAGKLQGIVAVRDSKDPDGPRLMLAPKDWRSFTAEIKAGKFDLA